MGKMDKWIIYDRRGGKTYLQDMRPFKIKEYGVGYYCVSAGEDEINQWIKDNLKGVDKKLKSHPNLKLLGRYVAPAEKIKKYKTGDEVIIQDGVLAGQKVKIIRCHKSFVVAEYKGIIITIKNIHYDLI